MNEEEYNNHMEILINIVEEEEELSLEVLLGDYLSDDEDINMDGSLESLESSWTSLSTLSTLSSLDSHINLADAFTSWHCIIL